MEPDFIIKVGGASLVGRRPGTWIKPACASTCSDNFVQNLTKRRRILKPGKELS